MLGGNPEIMALDKMRKEGYEEELVKEANVHTHTEDEEILKARAHFNELYEEFKKETDKEHIEVVKAGGLFILGTERHESRRIDNQLRGRSGRQGDPGESRFLIALDDDLMRRFGSSRVEMVMNMTGLPEDEPIEAKMLTGVIENAQKVVESNHFATRRNVLRYDDVINQQRTVIYDQRGMVLDNKDLKQNIYQMANRILGNLAESFVAEGWDNEEFTREVSKILLLDEPFNYDLSKVSADEVKNDLWAIFEKLYAYQEETFGDKMREVERVIMLRAVDSHWMRHIDDLAQLRDGIALRAYGHHDPVVEYQTVSSEMFDDMIYSIQEDTVSGVLRVRMRKEATERQRVAKVINAGESEDVVRKPVVNKDKKVGRNDLCPCGSGKKYKHCCANNE